MFNHQIYTENNFFRKNVVENGVKRSYKSTFWKENKLTNLDNRKFSWSLAKNDEGKKQLESIKKLISNFLKEPHSFLVFDIENSLYISEPSKEIRIYFYKREKKWAVRAIVFNNEDINTTEYRLKAKSDGRWNEGLYSHHILLGEKFPKRKKIIRKSTWPEGLRSIQVECNYGNYVLTESNFLSNGMSCPEHIDIPEEEFHQYFKQIQKPFNYPKALRLSWKKKKSVKVYQVLHSEIVSWSDNGPLFLKDFKKGKHQFNEKIISEEKYELLEIGNDETKHFPKFTRNEIRNAIEEDSRIYPLHRKYRIQNAISCNGSPGSRVCQPSKEAIDIVIEHEKGKFYKHIKIYTDW
jgi:hypothetical protein